MTRTTIIIVFILFASIASGQVISSKQLFGKWEGKDSTNQIGNIEFLDSNHLKLYIPNQGLYTCDYSLDTLKSPMWFDIVVKNGEQKFVLKGLVKFLSDTTLKWQIFPGMERTESFQNETSDNTIVLTKRLNTLKQ